MARAFGWLTFTTVALVAVFAGVTKSLGWSGDAVAGTAAVVVIFVVIGAGIAMSDYLALLAALVALTATGMIGLAIMMVTDGRAGYGHLLATAAAMVASFAAGIGCGWQFEAEPEHDASDVPLDWTR